MAGAVVDGESSRRCGPGAVGLDLHGGLVHEAAERDDPGRLFDAVKQVGVVDVPRGEVGERSAAQVLEFDQSRTLQQALISWWRPSACNCVFSSAEITYSSGRSRLPSKTRA